MKFTYTINGIHCSSCIEKIKSAIAPHFKILKITQDPPLLVIESQKVPSLQLLNSYISNAGNYSLSLTVQPQMAENALQRFWSYYPIFLITTYIIGVALIANFHGSHLNWKGWMVNFMAGFFLVFSGFKLLDLKGFATGYATYDLLAKRFFAYGYIYPFLELGLGILYLGNWIPKITLLLTIFIMGFSTLGVINSLMKKQKIQCACLGTLLKVPLSSITLIEDLTMVVFAALMLGHIINN